MQYIHIGDEDLKNVVLDLILALQTLLVARQLFSPNGRGILLGDLSRLVSLVVSNDFDFKPVIPLLNKVVDKAPDVEIWGAVYVLVTQSTPSPRSLPYLDRTPISFNTGSLVNTSEYRKHFDGVLKNELDSSLYIDIPDFFDAFFSELTSLELVAEAVFRKCKEGENPLYKDREGGSWCDWPEDAQEEKVLQWFKEWIDIFVEFAKANVSTLNVRRRPLRQPTQHLSGSTPKRKLDIGFANGAETRENF
ncbi:hypothetical protein GP486_002515 [Trichoglossum hirsutum]|uniref:Uncharacterized protein n=1 Tax=Trichoglossum hirsutum TaxID=265104 RepID=A0A9P8LET2_9PEZI|nr:hypothetical protein GP486_002515 [Trichoglossum hirsutum]